MFVIRVLLGFRSLDERKMPTDEKHKSMMAMYILYGVYTFHDALGPKILLPMLSNLARSLLELSILR